MVKWGKAIDGVVHCLADKSHVKQCGGCPYREYFHCEESLGNDVIRLLKGMLEQIEDTHSCKLCANYNSCSPDAEFDTPEYQIYAGCRGSMKENWEWKGVEEEDCEVVKQSPSRYLKAHPLCVVCYANGFYKKAKHVIWHNGQNNIGTALCDDCYFGRSEED